MGSLIGAGAGTTAPDLVNAMSKNHAYNAIVTPGAGVNVNVAPGYGKVAGTDVEIAGATNLATAAPGVAGQSIRYAIVSNASGVVSAIAGTAATTGSQVAPAVDQTQYVTLAWVDVANGAANITQSNITNSARNYP